MLLEYPFFVSNGLLAFGFPNEKNDFKYLFIIIIIYRISIKSGVIL